MADPGGIQETVNKAAIEPVTAVMMALRDTDVGT